MAAKKKKAGARASGLERTNRDERDAVDAEEEPPRDAPVKTNEGPASTEPTQYSSHGWVLGVVVLGLLALAIIAQAVVG